MMAGERRRTKWYASNWAVGSPLFHPPKPEKATDLGPAVSGWMMSFARGRRSPWSPAGTGSGGTMTVPTRKMWRWSARVSPTDLLRLHFQGTKAEERQTPSSGQSNSTRVESHSGRYLLCTSKSPRLGSRLLAVVLFFFGVWKRLVMGKDRYF